MAGSDPPLTTIDPEGNGYRPIVSVAPSFQNDGDFYGEGDDKPTAAIRVVVVWP